MHIKINPKSTQQTMTNQHPTHSMLFQSHNHLNLNSAINKSHLYITTNVYLYQTQLLKHLLGIIKMIVPNLNLSI